jgi:hypothetical protein
VGFKDKIGVTETSVKQESGLLAGWLTARLSYLVVRCAKDFTFPLHLEAGNTVSTSSAFDEGR